MSKLLELPDSLLLKIFDFVPVKDRFRTIGVCQRLSDLSVANLRSFDIRALAPNTWGTLQQDVFATICRRLAGQLTEVHWPRSMGTEGLWPWLPFALPEWFPNLTTFDAPLLDFQSRLWENFDNSFYETVRNLTVKSVKASTLLRFSELKSVDAEDVLEVDWPVGPDSPGFQFGQALHALLERFPDLTVPAADLARLAVTDPLQTNLPLIRRSVWGDDRNLDREDFKKISQLCPNLKDLSVESIPAARLDQLRWAESLVTLRLRWINSPSPGRLPTFGSAVKNLANLRNLYIHLCNAVSDFSFLQSLHQLRVLTIHTDVRPHSPIFFDLSPACPLKRLSVRCFDSAFRSSYQTVCVDRPSVMTVRWQSTLERLWFDFNSFGLWPHNQGTLLQLLEDCSAIKLIRLNSSYLDFNGQSLESLMHRLAGFSLKPTVEKISLDLGVSGVYICHGEGFSIPITTRSPS